MPHTWSHRQVNKMYYLRFTRIWYLYPVSGGFTLIVTGISFTNKQKWEGLSFVQDSHKIWYLYPVSGGSLLFVTGTSFTKKTQLRKGIHALFKIHTRFIVFPLPEECTLLQLVYHSQTNKFKKGYMFCLIKIHTNLIVFLVGGGGHSHCNWYIIHKQTNWEGILLSLGGLLTCMALDNKLLNQWERIGKFENALWKGISYISEEVVLSISLIWSTHLVVFIAFQCQVLFLPLWKGII